MISGHLSTENLLRIMIQCGAHQMGSFRYDVIKVHVPAPTNVPGTACGWLLVSCQVSKFAFFVVRPKEPKELYKSQFLCESRQTFLMCSIYVSYFRGLTLRGDSSKSITKHYRKGRQTIYNNCAVSSGQI